MKAKKFVLIFFISSFPLFLLLSTVLHVDHGKQPTTSGSRGALLNLLRQSAKVGLEIYAHDMLWKGIT